VVDLTPIRQNLSALQKRISRAAAGCGRDPASVRLVTVAKTQGVEAVRAAIHAGCVIVGENYIQEAREKFDVLAPLPVAWHFIGHLQTNKAKYAVRIFELIHTVDSEKLAAELDKQARKIGKVQNILVQVNIGAEPTKSGVDPDQAADLVRRISGYENICIQGLMAMPPFFDAPERARPFFRELRRVSNRIQEQIPRPALELSMGMSGDFEVAIQEGATLVRIGTAIFGARS
jgi:pyridoxal phosphate enzyme (YggS family)